MAQQPSPPQELAGQLLRFARAHTGDPLATVSDLEVMPGHAGFSYGFAFDFEKEGAHRRGGYVLRLPPPNVRFEGTADMLRQARVLRAVRGSGVPVAEVSWCGDDPRWFGRPYLIVPRLPGRTLWTLEGYWGAALDAVSLREMTRQAVQALVSLHAVDWQTSIPEWGPPLEPSEDVTRWDRFWERAAEPEQVKLGPELRRRLLESRPDAPRMGIYHGDYQTTNILYDGTRLVAVLDWELAGVGPVLGDLGWLMLFNDKESWCGTMRPVAPLPSPTEIQAMYAEVARSALPDVRWFRAAAGYKFAIISGFNLMLHRRGRRVDPHWEAMAPSIPRLLERALDVLDGAD